MAVSTATFYKWKSKFGGLEVSKAKRLRSLEDEAARRGDAGYRGVEKHHGKKVVTPGPMDAPLRARLRELVAERPLRLSPPRLSAGPRRHHTQPQEAASHLPRGRLARAPMTVPQGPNQRWSLDFVSDSFICSRRFRILCVVDDYSRECLALVADTLISGARVARELTTIIGQRGKPHMIVSDNGTELTSMAVLRWSKARRVEHYTAPQQARPRMRSSRASTASCATSASTKRCSPRWLMHERSWPNGNTITTRSGRTLVEIAK